MSLALVLSISIIIRAIAVLLALGLMYRIRDWRMAFLALMMALMGYRQGLTLSSALSAGTANVMPGTTELPGLAVSILGLLAIVFLERLLVRRQREQKTLRESETRYRQLFDSSPDALFILDAGGHFLECNQVAERRYGYSRQELLEMTARDLAAPDLQEQASSRVRQALESDAAFEWRHRRKDGTEIPVEINAAPIALGDQNCILSSVRDITERVNAEQERQKFAILADSSSEFIGMCDLDFNPLYVNPAGVHMVGLPDMDAACRVKVADYFFPEDQQFITDEFFPRVLREGHGEVEIRLRHFHTGEPIWMSYYLFHLRDASGTVIGWATVSHNITSRKRTEGKIARLNERITLATRAARLGIWDWDIVDNRLVWDAQMYALYGVRAEDFGGAYEAWVKGLHPDDVTHSETELQMALRSEKDFDTEFRVVWPDGTVRYLKANAAVFRDEDGNPVRMIGVNYDITERKHAEEKLRQSEERLRLSTELANVAVWDYDFTTNRMSRSKNHDQLYGLDWQPIWKFDTFLEATYPEDRDYSNQIIQKAAASGGPDDYQFDFRVVHPDGTIHWLFVVGQIIERDGEGRGLIARGSLIDITERKIAEQALHKSEERFSNAFYAGPAGMVITRIADGKFIDANNSFLRMFEFSREEVIGHTSTALNMWSPEERQRIIQQQLSSGGLREFELQARSKSGKIISLLFSSKPVELDGENCHITTMIDITERRRAEDEIWRSRALLRSVIDNSPALVYAFDLEHKLIMANKALAKLLDVQPKEIVGKSRKEFLPMDIAERDEAHDRQVIHTGKSIEFEEPGTFQGHPVTFLTTKSPLRDEQGDIWGLVGISTDITERVRSKEALKQSHDQLRSLAMRLAEVEEIQRRNIARELHDSVGQNLTALSINLNVLRSLIPVEHIEKVASFLDDSQNLIERTSGGIRDVMSELRPSELDDYGLAAALRWYTVGFAARNQIEVLPPPEDLHPRPRADVETALFRIAQEALTNIAKHAQASQVVMNLKQESSLLRLTISDNGIGFDSTSLEEGGERKKWGLLNIRERTVSIGGTLRIESQPGSGTQVIVEVPR